MEYLNQINTKPRKVLNFDNYYNNQNEITDLKYKIENDEISSLIISGESGSGVTHILNALCNSQLKQNKKVIYITTQWLLYINKLLKTEIERAHFNHYVSTFDSIAIDNLQFLHRKTKQQSNFIHDILTHFQDNHKLIILGCSDLNKDITKSKKTFHGLNLKRISLNQLSGYDVFKALKQLCSPEDQLPELLLYAISGYNGVIQQHINCLISVRFNPKLKEINSKDFSVDEFDNFFELKKYFPKQQLRKSFIQTQLQFMLKTETKNLSPIVQSKLV